MIAAAHLTRRFGDRVAVEDLSFEIRSGEIFGLLGPNGAGKTTTLRMLAGLIPPTSGSVTIDGVRVAPDTAGAARARVGFLTETPGLWERLTARSNLLIYAQLYSIPRPESVVDRLLRQFELWDRRDDQAAQLSKGMKQKLALARALAHDPPVILLDEPTAGLDPQTSRSVRDLVLALRGEGRAIVVSTHNLDEAERVADRVAVLQQRLVAVAAPNVLRRQLFGRRIRITVAGDADRFASSVASSGTSDVRVDGSVLSMAVDNPADRTPGIVRALVHAAADIREIVEEHPPLEEVYLRLLNSSEPEQDGG